MKKVDASLSIEVNCHCPYCDSFEDVFEYVRESLEDDHRASNIDIEVMCGSCGEFFIVDNVEF